MTEARALTVRFGFGELVGSESDYKLCQIVVHSDGSDTIYEVKQKIAAAVGGNFNAEDLMIFFNTNTTKMGKQVASADATICPANNTVLSFPAANLLPICLPGGTSRPCLSLQFQNDPRVNEHDVHLSQFNILEWLERFPHWHLSAKLLPPTPPPPGAPGQDDVSFCQPTHLSLAIPFLHALTAL